MQEEKMPSSAIANANYFGLPKAAESVLSTPKITPPATPPVPPAANPASIANPQGAASMANISGKAAAALAAQNSGANFTGASSTTKSSLLGPS